jgi:hypothetical protein
VKSLKFNLYYHLRNAGLTFTELEGKYDVKMHSIRKFIGTDNNNSRSVSFEELLKLSDILGVTVSDLLFDDVASVDRDGADVFLRQCVDLGLNVYVKRSVP